MRRFLFAVPPFAGHVLPAASIARELIARGHQVIWFGPPQVRPVLPPEVIFEEYPDTRGDDVGHRTARERGWAGLMSFIGELVVPFAKAMLPIALALIDRHRPDMLVVDQQMIAGALAARIRKLPWATLCSSSATVLPYIGLFPERRQELFDIKYSLERDFDLPHDPNFPDSSQLMILYATRGLVGKDLEFPAHYHFVGCVMNHRLDTPDFPWEWLAKRPRIFISLGTVREDRQGNTKFLKAALEALRDFDGQVIISTPPGLIENPPPHVLVREYVPQIELLKHIDLVITHGGHNTVCESLAHGLPLVVAPIRHDQPEVARLVENAGVGVRVRYGIITTPALRKAIDKVLNDPSYREAAGRMQEEFSAAGGEAAAAQALERLAEHPTSARSAV